jgi:predicted secreted protein
VCRALSNTAVITFAAVIPPVVVCHNPISPPTAGITLNEDTETNFTLGNGSNQTITVTTYPRGTLWAVEVDGSRTLISAGSLPYVLPTRTVVYMPGLNNWGFPAGALHSVFNYTIDAGAEIFSACLIVNEVDDPPVVDSLNVVGMD